MTLDELKKFCADEDDPRFYLHVPCTRGEYTYATNGHLLIRAPKIDGVAENEKFPDMDVVFAKAGNAGGYLPVPEMKMPEPKECDRCDGTGEHECTCGDEHGCHYCDGTGKVPNTDAVSIGGTFFAKRYIAAIQGWEISASLDRTKAAWIRNGDLLGLLMPMRDGPWEQT